jgi:hypothetical protein
MESLERLFQDEKIEQLWVRVAASLREVLQW